MTRTEFQTLLQEWCRNDGSDDRGFLELKNDLEFLESVLFHEFDPTEHGDHGDFSVRVARWVGSAQNVIQQQTLYLMLKNLIFIGRHEISAAYRTAYSKHFLSWLIEKCQIQVFQIDASELLEAALAKTLFTQITDSFGLAPFLRVNEIHGQNSRYTWEEHKNNWDADEFRQNRIVRNGQEDIRFVVLFEDFVGSGSQMEMAVRQACSLGCNIEVLLCPLIICPEGVRLAHALEREFQNLKYSPVLELEPDFFISPNPQPNENHQFTEIRHCLTQIHPRVMGDGAQNFGPFGYRDTGAFVVKFDNCPDNTVPAIHRQNGDNWRPLFFRTSREII